FQLRFADAVIAVTPALRDRLARRGIRDNVYVISNALDISEAPAANSTLTDYILTVGRVTAQKNVANLIRGYERFALRDKSAPRLMIVGGLDEIDYVNQLRPLMSNRVSLEGRLSRSRMRPLYRGARIYVNASVHEGSSNAVLEAISAGCPI